VVYKDVGTFSDSEIDSIIDLRKLLSLITETNISKEILPSRVQEVSRLIENETLRIQPIEILDYLVFVNQLITS
jgi:hypothetical protein